MLMQGMSRRPHSPALRQGIVFGVVLGAVLLVYNLMNNLANLDLTQRDIMNKGLFALLIAVFGLAGLRASFQSADFGAGIYAAVFASILSSIIGITTLFLLTSAFTDRIGHTQIVLGAFEASHGAQYRTMGTFLTESATEASGFGSWLSFTLALIMGAVGGLLGTTRSALHSRV